jgi:hypothetical protein
MYGNETLNSMRKTQEEPTSTKRDLSLNHVQKKKKCKVFLLSQEMTLQKSVKELKQHLKERKNKKKATKSVV